MNLAIQEKNLKLEEFIFQKRLDSRHTALNVGTESYHLIYPTLCEGGRLRFIKRRKIAKRLPNDHYSTLVKGNEL